MAGTDLLAAGMTVIGLGILTYGLYVIIRLRRLLETGTLKRAWDQLMVFVILFIVGYVGFLLQIGTGLHLLDANLIAATLFLFGAVFVAVAAYVNYDALSGGSV